MGDLIATPFSAPEADVVGGYIGKYRIVAQLGQGGMASVLLAVAQGPAGVQKLVALKVLRSAVAAEPETLAMFLDEARLAAQLNHSNVVKTYEVATEGGRHLIVMEYLEGQPLSAMLRRAAQSGSSVPLPHLLRVLINVLEGLHYAHELTSYDGTPLRLVHRDISPQNVFITYDGQVKLVDFGIAKATSSENHTAAGVIKGKLSYMAPEQMVASGIDRRADIYSVGCMLWAAAAGSKLWDGMATVDVARRVMSGRIPSPRSMNPECSPELERIVMTALAFDPAQRFQTALEFQEALEAYAETLPQQSRGKDVGAFIAALFADQRANVRAALEQATKLAPQDARGLTGSGKSPTGSAPSTRTSNSGEPTETVVYPTTPRWRPLLLALLVAAVAAAVFAHERFWPPTAAAPTAASSAPPTEVAFVEWELSALPRAATLSLDGQPLQGNPARARIPKEARTRLFSATAPGFVSKTRELWSDRSGALQISLEPAPSTTEPEPEPSESATEPSKRPKWARSLPAQKPKAGAPQPPEPTAATEPTEPPKASCEQPFFINSEGIRSVRPECM